MRNISPIKGGQVEDVIDYLSKQFRWGRNPPESIEEWQRRFFPRHPYPEVYQIIHLASQKLAQSSKGRIQFRHNLIQDTWRFHEGLDDYLMLLHGDQRRIAGHLRTQGTDFGYGKVLVPKIQDEIMIIDTPVINVGKMKHLELKQKYNPS